MTGFVYFIRPVGMAGPIKIGTSQEPRTRLDNLMSWSPFPLEVIVTIPGDSKLEGRIHTFFEPDFLHHEWFNASANLLSFIQKLVAGIPLEKAIDLTNINHSIFRRRASNGRTDDQKLCTRYAMRIRWAERTMPDGMRSRNFQVEAPDMVFKIIKSWRRRNEDSRLANNSKPSDEEMSILDDFISNPYRAGIPRVPRPTPTDAPDALPAPVQGAAA